MPASKLHSSPEMHVIEHVQRNFTEILAGLQSLPYTERLKRLDLDSLDLRWLRADLVWCYKIIFGLVCLDVNKFVVLNTNSRTRRHAFKLFKARCSGIRATFFCNRVINPTFYINWLGGQIRPISLLLPSNLHSFQNAWSSGRELKSTQLNSTLKTDAGVMRLYIHICNRNFYATLIYSNVTL